MKKEKKKKKQKENEEENENEEEDRMEIQVHRARIQRVLASGVLSVGGCELFRRRVRTGGPELIRCFSKPELCFCQCNCG